jgi:deoxycytidine triphosphate deaminase
MSFLSDSDIEQRLKSGDIICEPFNEANLSNSSIDLRLGQYLIKQKTSWWRRLLRLDVVKFELNENGKLKVNNPNKTEKHDLLWNSRTLFPCNYVLKPGGFVLSSTLEYVGSNSNYIICQVADKSTLARLGLSVCFSAGYIDSNNVLNITLEIKNNGYVPIELQYGMHICQLKLAYLASPSFKPYDGKYLNNRTVEIAK